MRLFGLGRKYVAAEVLGHNLLTLAMDADDCWKDVCGLRSYKTTGPVATCEVALARAAIARSCLKEHRNPDVSDRLGKAAAACVVETFAGEDTEDTLSFYGGPISERGLFIVELYEQSAVLPSQWASLLGRRLGVPGVGASEITSIAEQQRRSTLSILSKVKIV